MGFKEIIMNTILNTMLNQPRAFKSLSAGLNKKPNISTTDFFKLLDSYAKKKRNACSLETIKALAKKVDTNTPLNVSKIIQIRVCEAIRNEKLDSLIAHKEIGKLIIMQIDELDNLAAFHLIDAVDANKFRNSLDNESIKKIISCPPLFNSETILYILENYEDIKDETLIEIAKAASKPGFFDKPLKILIDIVSKIKKGDNLIALISEIQDKIKKVDLEFLISDILRWDELNVAQLCTLYKTIKNKQSQGENVVLDPCENIKGEIQMKNREVINTLCDELTIPIKDRQFYYVLFSDSLLTKSTNEIKANMRSHKLAIEKIY